MTLKPTVFAKSPKSIRHRAKSGAVEKEGRKMPLERGNVKGFEHNRMVMLFSMMNGDTEISCAVAVRRWTNLNVA